MLIEQPQKFPKNSYDAAQNKKLYIKKFGENQKQTYTASNYKNFELQTLIYSETQLEHAYSEYLTLKNYYTQTGWAEHFTFTNQGHEKPPHETYQTPDILIQCKNIEDTDTVNKYLTHIKNLHNKNNTPYYMTNINLEDLHFQYHKQRAEIFNLNLKQKTLLNHALKQTWEKTNPTRTKTEQNNGTTTTNYIQLMETYNNILEHHLTQNKIEPTTHNKIQLHNYSHQTSKNQELTQTINTLTNPNTKHAVNKWCELIKRNYPTEFLKTLILTQTPTKNNHQHIKQLKNLWHQTPKEWFLKIVLP